MKNGKDGYGKPLVLRHSHSAGKPVVEPLAFLHIQFGRACLMEGADYFFFAGGIFFSHHFCFQASDVFQAMIAGFTMS